MPLILDTGPLYASLDRSDVDHQVRRRLIETAAEPLLVPAPVLVEVGYWIRTRLPGLPACGAGIARMWRRRDASVLKSAGRDHGGRLECP
jgi:predicted nucleic acid-binding protein